MSIGGALFVAVGVTVHAGQAADLVFVPCAEDSLALFDCASVSVPLARDDVGAGSLTLAIARHSKAIPGQPVLLALAGGPGQSAINFASTFERVFAAVLDRVQVVVIDQRGTGRSGALECSALNDGAEDAIARCATDIGFAAQYYTTADSVADIEAVRTALGVERLLIAGVSYGTLVGLEYARTYPDRVEALLLDSTVPPAAPSPFNLESVLAVPRVLSDLCAGNACYGISSHLAADIATVVVRLAAPLRGRVVGPRGRRVIQELSSPSDMLALLLATDLNPALRSFLPAAMAAATSGDDVPLLRMAWLASLDAEQEAQTPPTVFSRALQLATVCGDVRFPWEASDALAIREEARAAAVASLTLDLAPFDRATVAGFGSSSLACLHWPYTSLARALSAAPLPDVRVLLLGGRLDVRTPIENAATVGALLPRATTMLIPNVGHSVLTAAPCARTMAAEFLLGNASSDGCREQAPAFSMRFVPKRPADLPWVGLSGRPGAIAAVIDATLRDALAAAVAAEASSVALGGLRGGRLTGEFGPESATLKLRRYALLARAPVTGRVTFDDRGTTGRLRVRGRLRGTARFRGNRATIASRGIIAELGPAVHPLFTEPGLSRDVLPPLR